MRKLFYITLLSFLCFTIGFSQKAIDYIPNDADLVIKIDFKQLNKKYSATKIENLNWIKELRQELFRNSNLNLNSLGINYNKSAYFFGKLIDLKEEKFDAYWAIPIESETDFKNALTKEMPHLKEESLGKFNIYYNKGDDFIAYANNIAIIGHLDKKNIQDFLKTFKGKFKESKLGCKKADASVYFNNAVYNNLYKNLFNLGYGLTPKFFKNFNLKYGSQSTFNLFFNKNDIQVKIKSDLGKHYTKKLKKIKSRKFNKTLLKYIDKNNLGYMALNFNNKSYLKNYPELFSSIYDGFYGITKKEILAAYDLFSIFIDEDDLADLLPGSGLFVINNVKQEKYTYTAYRYNKDYKREKYKKEGTRTAPVFTVALESKKAKKLKTVLDLALRKAFELELDKKDDFPFEKIQLENSEYYLIKENSELKEVGPLALYFDKNAVILTNDFTKIANININSSLNRRDKKLIQKNNLTFKINFNPILKLAEKDLSSSALNKSERLKALEKVRENISNIELNSKIKRGITYGNFKINKPNNSLNSFEAIFKTLEEIYDITEGK